MFLPIAIVAIVFSFVGLIVYLGNRTETRRRELLNTERLAALQRGMDLPPEALLDGKVRKEGGGSPLFSGLVALLVGLAITFALYLNDPREPNWAWGLIIVAAGISALIYWPIRGKREWEETRLLDQEMKRAWIERQTGRAAKPTPTPSE